MCREGQQAETVPNTIGEGGVGGVKAAAHAIHLKTALRPVAASPPVSIGPSCAVALLLVIGPRSPAST